MKQNVNFKTTKSNNRKITNIGCFIFLIVIVLSTISVVCYKSYIDNIEANNKLQNNIKEENNNLEEKTENTKEEIEDKNEPNKDDSLLNKESPTEDENKDTPVKDESKPNKDESTSNQSSSSNSSSTQKPSQNNSSSSNSSSNSNNSTTETPTTPTPEITPVITEVTDNIINLNNYETDLKITKGGEYTLSGTLNYSLYIETNSDVTLNLNGANIYSKTDAAIANINTNLLTINLVSGKTNKISDASNIESQYDGCLFSNGEITIEGTGNLNVYGNQIDGEGIATKNSAIIINNGNIKIYSVDDGLNTGGIGGPIEINNGTVYIEAGGDGIDSNQDIIFNGGTTFVVGGSKLINGGLDADQQIEVNGGQLIALGTDQLQAPNTAEQTVLCMNLLKAIPKGTMVTLLDENENIMISFEANDSFKNMIVSLSNITTKNFTIYTGGTNTGTKMNGIYLNGEYTKGTAFDIKGRKTFEIYSTITTY